MVAKTFLSNPLNIPEVNHIDENKLNNKVSNLKWVSRSDNSKHSNARPIYQYDIEGNLLKEWESIQEASTETKIWNSGIIRC